MEVHAFRSEHHKATDELSEVVGHLKTSRSSLEYFEQQTYTWKEECRTLILRGREQESKYEAEIISMKSEMTVLAGEITILRARFCNGSSEDDVLLAKCTQLALENENFVPRMWDTERQLVLARRGEAEIEVSLRKHDPGHCAIRSQARA